MRSIGVQQSYARACYSYHFVTLVGPTMVLHPNPDFGTYFYLPFNQVKGFVVQTVTPEIIEVYGQLVWFAIELVGNT